MKFNQKILMRALGSCLVVASFVPAEKPCPLSQTLKIVSPTNGAVLTIGQPVTVTWTSSGLVRILQNNDYFRIALYKGTDPCIALLAWNSGIGYDRVIVGSATVRIPTDCWQLFTHNPITGVDDPVKLQAGNWTLELIYQQYIADGTNDPPKCTNVSTISVTLVKPAKVISAHGRREHSIGKSSKERLLVVDLQGRLRPTPANGSVEILIAESDKQISKVQFNLER